MQSRRPPQRPQPQPSSQPPCDNCISQKLHTAVQWRYKMLEYMLQAEAECGNYPEIAQQINELFVKIKADGALVELQQSVATQLKEGKDAKSLQQ
jgi:hypothetical protein